MRAVLSPGSHRSEELAKKWSTRVRLACMLALTPARPLAQRRR
jgi:hypothetical protein